MQAGNNVFENGGGEDSPEFFQFFDKQQKDKFANRKNPKSLSYVCVGGCEHPIELRFHCGFSKFSFQVLHAPKKLWGRANSMILQIFICKF